MRLKPNDDRVRFNLGNGCYAAGRPDDAMREFTRAVALNAGERRRALQPGDDLGPRGQLDEAIAHLRRVIEIDPQRADAHRNLAMALGLQGASTRRSRVPAPRSVSSLATRPTPAN